ncbi:MAG TPA: hypothetical protein VF960_09515 [Chloroflexota bacterium]
MVAVVVWPAMSVVDSKLYSWKEGIGEVAGCEAAVGAAVGAFVGGTVGAAVGDTDVDGGAAVGAAEGAEPQPASTMATMIEATTTLTRISIFLSFLRQPAPLRATACSYTLTLIA